MGCQASRAEISSHIQGKMPEAQYNIEEQKNFYILQLFTGCLSEMAYYIESEKEAIVIDPLREIEPYLEIAKKRQAKIKYIFVTHFHADFVCGHCDLAKQTGAQIVFGPTAQAQFDFYLGKDNEVFKVGAVSIKLLHTPGHTQESSSYLLLDGEKEHAVFTGDTLFLGEVGRPDLAVKSEVITKEDLAGLLYDSLRNKIMTLNPSVIVYPGHGAGSACGKKIQSGPFDTLENQLKTNYALQKMEKAEFVKQVSSDLPVPPKYFFHDVAQNKKGPVPVDEVLQKSLVFIKPKEFLAQVQKTQNSIVIDSRSGAIFEKGYIEGSINIPLSTNFAVWVGNLVSALTPIFIIAESGKEKETIIRLARIGYDHVAGCLDGGFEAYFEYQNQVKTVKNISANDVTMEMFVIDVRNIGELSAGYINGSLNIPLNDTENILKENGAKIPRDKPVYVHCKSGVRSLIACSIFQKHGLTNIINITGGFDALKQNHDLKFVGI